MIDGLTATGVRYTVILNVVLYVPYNLENVNTFITGQCGLQSTTNTLAIGKHTIHSNSSAAGLEGVIAAASVMSVIVVILVIALTIAIIIGCYFYAQ